jgi:hypothetical protein
MIDAEFHSDFGAEVSRLRIFFDATAPHNCVCGVLRKISVGNALSKLEIHKVFLRFSAFFRQKFSAQSLLAELCGAADKFF